jgi:hypothetical protein
MGEYVGIQILEWNLKLVRDNNAKTLVLSGHSTMGVHAADLVCDGTIKDGKYSPLDEQKPRPF